MSGRVGAPSGVWLVAGLVALMALLTLLDGAAAVLVGVTGADTSAGAPSGLPLIAVGVVGVLLGLVFLFLAARLLRGSNTARWWVIVLALIGLGSSLMSVVWLPDHRISSLVRAVVQAAVVALLLTPRARRHFRDEEPFRG